MRYIRRCENVEITFVQLGDGRRGGLELCPHLLRVELFLVVQLIFVVGLGFERLDALLLPIAVPEVHYRIILAPVVAHRCRSRDRRTTAPRSLLESATHTHTRARRATHEHSLTHARRVRARAHTRAPSHASRVILAVDLEERLAHLDSRVLHETLMYCVAVNLSLCCTRTDYRTFFDGKERSKASMTRATSIAFRSLSLDHPGSPPSLRSF